MRVFNTGDELSLRMVAEAHRAKPTALCLTSNLRSSNLIRAELENISADSGRLLKHMQRETYFYWTRLRKGRSHD